MNPRLIVPHRVWIRNQRKRYPALPTDDAMEIEGECACGNCGCLGNNECGHACLDDDNGCTLLGDYTCPCCMIESMPATDAQMDAITGQCSLFSNAGAVPRRNDVGTSHLFGVIGGEHE